MLTKLRAHLTQTSFFCFAVFVIGTIFRWRYTFVVHDPRNYIDSDMKLYIDLAKRFARPGFVAGVGWPRQPGRPRRT